MPDVSKSYFQQTESDEKLLRVGGISGFPHFLTQNHHRPLCVFGSRSYCITSLQEAQTEDGSGDKASTDSAGGTTGEIIQRRFQPVNESASPPNETWLFTSHSEADTKRLGQSVADVLEPGTVVALIGHLGAGKTRLVQAIAVAMGIERKQINSPTFVLIQEYEGRLPIFHFDAYRLHDSDEFLELGADELTAGCGVCLIEWADRVSGVLPTDLLRVEIEIEGPTRRAFHFSSSGPISRAAVSRLPATLRDR